MSQTGSPSLPPLFTIEQTELIRRLRRTGLTKEQLLFAFESFDRLDRELGGEDGNSNPVSPNSSSNGPLNYSQNSLTNGSGGVGNSFLNGSFTQSMNLPSCSFASQQRKMMELGLVPSGMKRPYSMLDDSMDAAGYDSLLGESMLAAGEGVAAQRVMGKPHKMLLEAETEEFVLELSEFALKGENVIFEEIRDFVHKHGVKQHQLAAFCGLSQSYVSRYLRGDYHDIADKSKRAIHRWYLVCKKNPAALVMTLNTTFVRRPSLNTMTPIMSQIPMGLDHSDFFGSQRRERFVFKQAHIEILEKHFKMDNYPSFQKREEIARECNSLAENNRADGRPLSEREIVNVQVVTNWYANKRKELKKIAKEEGLDNIIAQMRSRGRPCASRVEANPNPFSGIENLTSNHGNGTSNGLHSNTINSILQNSSLQNNSPAIHQHLIQQMQQLQQQQQQQLVAEQLVAGDEDGDNEFLNGDEDDGPLNTDQLSMAVEVAAVNSAILQLHDNQLASIKQELAQTNQTSQAV